MKTILQRLFIAYFLSGFSALLNAQIPTSHLEQWLRADKDVNLAVGASFAWGDQSGKGNSLLRYPAGFPNPTPPVLVMENGITYLSYGNFDELFITSPKWPVSSSGLTIFMVHRNGKNFTGNLGGLETMVGSISDTSIKFPVISSNSASFNITRFSSFLVKTPYSGNNNWQIGTVVFTPNNAAGSKTYINGSLYGESSSTGIHVPTSFARWLVTGAGLSVASDGENVAEIIIYSAPLNNTDRQTVENYLASKYGTGPPSASITDKTLLEGNTGTSVMNFKVTLSHASDTTVKIKYTTADSTAKTGSDYVATQGTLKFYPGKTSKIISVTINGDVTPEGNEKFKVILSNPVNAFLSDAVGIGTIKNDDGVPTQNIADLSEDNAITKTTITLSPNPARDVLHITGLIPKNTLIEIINVSGTTLIRYTVLNIPPDITISKLPAGNYFAKISMEDHVEVFRFVKQ